MYGGCISVNISVWTFSLTVCYIYVLFTLTSNNLFLQVQPTASCIEAYAKQSFCPLCQGLTSLRPCNEYCMNVMKGCLAYHAEIDASWAKYLSEYY